MSDGWKRGTRTAAMTLGVAWLASSAAAQSTRVLTPTDYYQVQTVSEPALSPDGTLVAYLVTNIDRAQNRRLSDLWIAPADGGGAPWPFATGQGARSPRWTPDGSSLGFIAARPAATAPAGAPAPRAQVYVQSVARGGEPRRITDLKDGADAFTWSPDGRRLAVVSKVAPETQKGAAEASDLKRYTHAFYKLDGQGYFDQKRAHIFVVDAATGAAKQVTSGAERNDEVPSWSPDGRTLVFAANRTDVEGEGSLDVWTVPASGGTLTKVSDVLFRIASPCWSPDGTRVAYVGAEDPHIPRMRVAPAGGGASTVVAEDFTFPTDLSWSADGRSLYANDDVKGESHLFKIDLASQKVTAVTSGSRMVSRPDVKAAIGRVAYLVATTSHPADVFVADLSGTNERQITHANDAWLQAIRLASVERFTFKSVDGWDIDGFFVKPVDWQEGKTYPMILAVHGGPNGMYSVGWQQDFQAMAAQGYAVVYTNPRGSSGYGARFQRGVVNEWGGKAYEDIMRGVDTVLAKYPWIDRNRLAVTGQSYGGFMTDWIVGHTQRFGAAITLSGIADFISDDGTRDGFYGHAADLGGHLFDRFDEYWNTSPLKYASKVKTPTLILHGDADQRVPVLQGEEWFRALRHFGVPSELVIFPREPHSLRREPRHQVEVIELTLEWCDRYLQGAPASARKP